MDTEDEKCDVYYVKMDDLIGEYGGCRHDLERICGGRHDTDWISREDMRICKCSDIFEQDIRGMDI